MRRKRNSMIRTIIAKWKRYKRWKPLSPKSKKSSRPESSKIYSCKRHRLRWEDNTKW